MAHSANVPVGKFGKDHWSTFAYVECRVVDHGGVLNRVHMRCDPALHIAHAHEGSSRGEPSPTRLRGGELLPGHDDWSCVDDLDAAGLVESRGTGVNPWFRLTKRGFRVALLLRKHRSKGGSFSDFVLKPARKVRA